MRTPHVNYAESVNIIFPHINAISSRSMVGSSGLMDRNYARVMVWQMKKIAVGLAPLELKILSDPLPLMMENFIITNGMSLQEL